MMKKTSGIILLYLLRSTLCIPLSDFYPFRGNTPDAITTLGNGNSITATVSNPPLIRFYNNFEIAITVSYVFDHTVP